MEIINRYRNMLNLACDAVLFYNVYCRLTFLVDGSWSIRDLESRVLWDRSEPLDHFGGPIEGAELGVY